MKKLFYILGALRDGSIPKCRNKFELSLASDYDINWLNKIKQIAEIEFNLDQNKIKIYKFMSNKSKRFCYRIKIYSKDLYNKLSTYYKSGCQKTWNTPLIVEKSNNKDFLKEYIAGFYDAEGGCRNVQNFKSGISKTIQCWASIRCFYYGDENKPLIFLQSLLRGIGIKSQIYDSDELVLTGKRNLHNFYRTIPLKHPKKKEDLKNLLSFYS